MILYFMQYGSILPVTDLNIWISFPISLNLVSKIFLFKHF